MPLGGSPLPPRPAAPMAPGNPGLPPSGLPPQFAKAPGQADRPVQPLSQFGMGRPGLPSSLMAGAGLPGTPMDTPLFEAANRAFAPMANSRKRKRGSRGRGGKK